MKGFFWLNGVLLIFFELLAWLLGWNDVNTIFFPLNVNVLFVLQKFIRFKSYDHDLLIDWQKL